MGSTEYFKRRVSQGLCGACGKPNDRPDKTTCSACSKKRVQEIAEDRNFYKSKGICPRCHKNMLMGQEKVCIECKAYSTNYIMVKREKNKDEYNEYMRNYRKNQTEKRRLLGLCTRCGNPKTDGRYVMCEICRAKNRTDNDNTESGKERVENGLCYWCGSPVKSGFKVCEKHYQMNCEKAKKSNKDYMIKTNKILFTRY